MGRGGCEPPGEGLREAGGLTGRGGHGGWGGGYGDRIGQGRRGGGYGDRIEQGHGGWGGRYGDRIGHWHCDWIGQGLRGQIRSRTWKQNRTMTWGQIRTKLFETKKVKTD